MTFQLKPFQETAKQRMVREMRHFLFFRMGLGKTPTTTVAGYETRAERWIILCPKNSIRTWEDHIKEWFEGLDIASERTTDYAIFRWRKKYNNASKRRALWNQSVPDCVNVYIMTYAAYIADYDYIPKNHQIIICDEAKRIRSRKSKAFDGLKAHVKTAKYFWPMTGTPGKLPLDVWTLFHLADPKRFGSYWKFVSAFHHTLKNQFGGQEVFGLKNEQQWYWQLNQKASVVSKEMVKDQIGIAGEPIQRQLLHVELDDVQEKLYRELEQEMMTVTPDGQLILAGTSLTKTLRLRQLLVCPKLLNPTIPSYGAALEDLVETLTDTDPHIVIFTPFTEAFPHIRERLLEAGHQHIVTLDGTITPDEQADRINYFRKHRGIAIVSILYAQSFSLEPATECFFLGYEWNPEDNEQAEERLQRLTTRNLINAYYYAYEGTYDEQQAEIVCLKHQQARQTFDISKVGLKFDQ